MDKQSIINKIGEFLDEYSSNFDELNKFDKRYVLGAINALCKLRAYLDD